MMWAGNGSVDYAMHILKVDAKAVTAMMARDPNVVGTTAYASTVADAFDRFAADCAKSTKCAANGDMKVLLAKALDRLKTPVTTKTVDKATGSPVVLDAPKITSDIPVLVILSSYDSRSSEAVAKSIFAGFSHASFATATGVSAPLQKAPCFFTVTSAFASAPTTPVDTSCMSGIDGNTFT